MPTKSKAAQKRSEAAKKAARTRKRNERKAAKAQASEITDNTVEAPKQDEAFTERREGLVVVERPQRRTGEVEMSRRADPTKDEVAPTVRTEGTKTVLSDL